MLGLLPWEFYDLTVREFRIRIDGHLDAKDDDWYRTAWLASRIMSLWVKRDKARSIDPMRLLRRGKLGGRLDQWFPSDDE